MDLLPDTSKGYLPLFVLLVGVTAITNALQCYRDVSYLQRIYNPPEPSHDGIVKTTTITKTVEEDKVTPVKGRRPSVASIAVAEPKSAVTPLSARTFGTWNIAVGIARLYAAYNLHEKSWYQMSMWTNVIGLAHFTMEAFVYKTARPQGPWLAPVLPASIGLVWHLVYMSNYVESK